MSGECRLGQAHCLCAVSLLTVTLVWTGALAEEVRASAALFPDPASACFTAGVPPKGRLSPLSSITSLIIRPQNPDTDGDGSYPPDVAAMLEPDVPGAVPMTLIVGFEDGEVPAAGARWGARFICDPQTADESRYACGVADWCSDVGFELRIESEDRVSIDVLPDAGPVGMLGDPCRDTSHRSLSGPSNETITYALDRRPAHSCR